MALESGSYVGDLNASNPAATDPKSQGDDHLRLIKAALLQSFPGFAGAVIATGVNGGSANAYTLTPTTALPGYVANMVALFSPAAQNTGASTLNISGLGTKTIKTIDGATLSSADLVVGQYYAAVYDGTDFRLLAVTKRYVDGLAFSTALPNQTGNGGKFLTTDGSAAAWSDTLPTLTKLAGSTSSFPALKRNSAGIDVRLADDSAYAALLQLCADVAAVRAGSNATWPMSVGNIYAAFAEVTLTDAATIAVDMSTFINARVTLGGNRTLGNPTNPKVGQTGYIAVVQDGTGSRTLSYASNWKRAGGAPVLTTTAAAIDFIFYEVITATYILYDLKANPS